MKHIAACLAVLLLAAPSPASQKPCRDSDGKVVKCPKPRVANPRCKDANGRFVRCPEAKPTPRAG